MKRKYWRAVLWYHLQIVAYRLNPSRAREKGTEETGEAKEDYRQVIKQAFYGRHLFFKESIHLFHVRFLCEHDLVGKILQDLGGENQAPA